MKQSGVFLQTEVVKVVRPRVRERLSADFAAAILLARLADLVLGEASGGGF